MTEGPNTLRALPAFPAGGVCLNMIVKDEAKVIERCLRSVLPHINSWCIVDTGSSDRTKEIIVKTLAGLPGALYERPWVDFATNRNEAWGLALQHHRPESLMFIDADEELEIDGLIPRPMRQDAYLIDVAYQNRMDPRFWMVRSDYPNRWLGIVHEDIEAHGSIAKMTQAIIISHEDGARSEDRSKKLNGDLRLLLEALTTNPKDSRSWYYLGATYAAARDFEQARRALGIRAQMGGDPREVARAIEFLDQTEPSTIQAGGAA